ncbi:hypothetical protein IAQ61_001091 [Plenodomus lingam]|uniref:Predicted protein n=1 Tax=Leptosphaeria maculans (strain JN3 / isolate v23.1.3 / race Av1-4-5-6-7-8) TaxID=985895 RepID=E5A1Y6_LEPMJ|nr:predicted protein [Plenodomus lingam JN3]KAH9880797.1 hypothetical protein IAQ61_001091 [Plenodomus lingam]CBX97703.1 predicted protein [Plenodomus lingam JN3]
MIFTPSPLANPPRVPGLTQHLHDIPPSPNSDVKTVALYNRHLHTWTQISYDAKPQGLRFLGANTSIAGQPQKRYTEEEWGEIERAARKRYSGAEWEKVMGTVGPGQ